MTDTRDKLAALIVQHQRIPLFDDTFGQRCVGCDSLYGETDGPNWSRHAEHLADALLASDVLRDLLAEAEARGRAEVAAAVEEVIATHGKVHMATHRWVRDDHLRNALADRGALDRVRAEALREAAREARERGDIGKEGGYEAWDWLAIRADQAASIARTPGESEAR